MSSSMFLTVRVLRRARVTNYNTIDTTMVLNE